VLRNAVLETNFNYLFEPAFTVVPRRVARTVRGGGSVRQLGSCTRFCGISDATRGALGKLPKVLV